MKRIISFILVLVMVVLCVGVTTYAEETEWMFKDVFLAKYKNDWIPENFYYYAELYYHYDNEEQLDWVLVEANWLPPEPRNYYAVLGDMVSYHGECLPFRIGHAVYDIKQQEFRDICDLDSLAEYEGLEEQLIKYRIIFPIGDVDRDGELTVLDATLIRMVIAGIKSPYDDLSDYQSIKGELKYSSDFDRDGERTVLDATAIQLKLAGLSE